LNAAKEKVKKLFELMRSFIVIFIVAIMMGRWSACDATEMPWKTAAGIL